MPNIAPDADITAALRAEVSAVERFVALLQSEQALLQSAETDGLARLAEQKSTLAADLVGLAQTRNERLARAGFANDRAGLTAWSAAAGAGAAALFERLIERAGEARELNRLNGSLVALQLNRTHAALAALAPERTRSSVYGRDGQTTASTGYRFIDSV